MDKLQKEYFLYDYDEGIRVYVYLCKICRQSFACLKYQVLDFCPCCGRKIKYEGENSKFEKNKH